MTARMGDKRSDPSMEDILASIRRIIAEEVEPMADATPMQGIDEVLELTDPIDPADPAPDIPQTPTPAILSDDAANASRDRLAALSSMIVKGHTVSDNTLEGLVREMLRPMLKDWLDQRLPVLVEHLVEKEIARITGRSL